MNKIVGKIIYCGSVIAGGCIALFGGSLGWGMGTLFVGCMIGIMINFANEDFSSGYYTSEPEKKKPYYKNEFEEYQHYKFVKKHMK